MNLLNLPLLLFYVWLPKPTALTSKCYFCMLTTILRSNQYSFFIWSISKPSKTGGPTVNKGVNSSDVDLIITETFKHYNVPLSISDTIRTAFRTKLWRMGKLFRKLGGTKRKNQLERWTSGEESV